MSRLVKNGFTLVELLIVILILTILMGITLPVMRSAYSRAKAARAKADISKFESAAEVYKSDWGAYPPSGNANLYPGLKSISPVTKRPYVVFKSKDLNSAGTELVDPWGKSYSYTSPGANHTGVNGTDNTKSVDIYSPGPDRTDNSGAGDDINNWMK